MGNNKTVKVWCLGSFYDFKQDYRSTQAIHLMKNSDFIICKRSKEYQDFIKHYSKEYKIADSQIIWYPEHYETIDQYMKEEGYKKIIDLAKVNKEMQLIPTMVTQIFADWYQLIKAIIKSRKIKCRLTYSGDNLDWMALWGKKSILYPNWDKSNPSKNSPLKEIVPDIGKILNEGYICHSKTEIKEVFEHFDKTPIVIKEIDSCGGDGIVFAKTEQEIDELTNTILLSNCIVEKDLTDSDQSNCDQSNCDQSNSDQSNSDQPIFTSVLYKKSKVIDKPYLQLFSSPTAYCGAHSLKHKKSNEIKEWTEKIVSALHAKGRGGLDFCIKGDNLYLIDVNTARFNGTHIGLELMQKEKYKYFYQYRKSFENPVLFEDLKSTLEKNKNVKIMYYTPNKIQVAIFSNSHTDEKNFKKLSKILFSEAEK